MLIVAYILIEKFLEKLDIPTPVDLHMLFCVSVFTSQKMVLDLELWTAEDFALFGMISEKELKSREIEFLHFLDFAVHVGEVEYHQYFNELSNEEFEIPGNLLD